VNKLAAVLLGYMFLRPRGGVMGADGSAVRDQRQGGKWHGWATKGHSTPRRPMQQYGANQQGGHRSSLVDPSSDPAFQTNPDGSVTRAPPQPTDPYGNPYYDPYGNPGGYPGYDPSMMDAAYAQQYYGGVAYPGTDYYGGTPVSYGGYNPYGSTYGGDEDLQQYQAELQAWMEQ